MINLIASILFLCIIPVITKIASIKRYNIAIILLLNYFFASAVSFVIAMQQSLFTIFPLLSISNLEEITTGNSLPNTALLCLSVGVSSGIFFYLNLLFSQKSIMSNGMGISSFFSHIGFIGAIFAGVVFWNEELNAIHWVAIAGILLALFILVGNLKVLKIQSPMLLSFLLLCGTVIEVNNKVFSRYAISSYEPMFLAIAFFTAFIVAGIYSVYKKEQLGTSFSFNRWEVVCGLILGSSNMLNSYFKLKSLEELPSGVVFPTLSASGLIFSTLFGILIFKEKTNWKHIVSMLIATICIILINI